MPLPARFTSLYRLVLRATAASVRHHGTATRNLRGYYRPEFEEAAQVVKELARERERDEVKEKWYTEWEQRMYSSISMMVLSANPLKSSVPSRLTRNHTQMRFSLLSPPLSQHLFNPVRWDPQNIRGVIHKGEAYFSRAGNTERHAVYDAVGRAMDELLQAAEGSAGVVLGRIKAGVLGRKLRVVKKEKLASRKRWRGAEEALAGFKWTR